VKLSCHCWVLHFPLQKARRNGPNWVQCWLQWKALHWLSGLALLIPPCLVMHWALMLLFHLEIQSHLHLESNCEIHWVKLSCHCWVLHFPLQKARRNGPNWVQCWLQQKALHWLSGLALLISAQLVILLEGPGILCLLRDRLRQMSRTQRLPCLQEFQNQAGYQHRRACCSSLRSPTFLQ